MKKLLLLALAALALPASAQESCSKLNVQISPTDNPLKDSVLVEIAGSAPQRPTWIMGGLMDKPVTIVYGQNLILESGVSVPVLAFYLGLTDKEGNFRRSYLVPSDINLTLYAQAVTLEFTRMPNGNLDFGFCTSNVLQLGF